MFERRRADDEDPLDVEMAGHDLGRGDGLDRLAQAHLIADQTPPRSRGEERPFLLVVIKRCPARRRSKPRLRTPSGNASAINPARRRASRTSATNGRTSSYRRKSGSISLTSATKESK